MFYMFYMFLLSFTMIPLSFQVFGPTIVGYSSPEPEALQMLNEPRMQADVLEMLMSGIGPAFWEGIVKADDASWMSFNTTNGDATVTT